MSTGHDSAERNPLYNCGTAIRVTASISCRAVVLTYYVTCVYSYIHDMMLRFYGHRNRIYNFNAMATECDRYNTSTRRRNAFRKKRLADELLTTSTLAYSLFNIHVTFFCEQAARRRAGERSEGLSHTCSVPRQSDDGLR